MKAPIGSPFDTLAPSAFGPNGMGVFLASGDTMCSPIERGRAVDRLSEARIRWAALWVEAPDGEPEPRRASLDAIRRWGEALRARGIAPWVWSFPRPGAAAGAAKRLGAALRAADAAGAILDVEDPDGKGPQDWEPVHARALIEGTINELTEKHGLALTSYPGRKGFGLPWEELVVGVGMPQFYGTADDPKRTRRLREEWVDLHGTVVPITSVRTPGQPSDRVDAERLRARLSAITLDERGDPCVRGAGVWAYGMLQGSHRRVLAEWSEALGW